MSINDKHTCFGAKKKSPTNEFRELHLFLNYSFFYVHYFPTGLHFHKQHSTFEIFDVEMLSVFLRCDLIYELGNIHAVSPAPLCQTLPSAHYLPYNLMFPSLCKIRAVSIPPKNMLKMAPVAIISTHK